MRILTGDKIDGVRQYHAIGRIKACSSWRNAGRPQPETDRVDAIRKLLWEAEENGADAVVCFGFEVDRTSNAEIGVAPLCRIAAVGIAVRFDYAS
jgi:uncharacterized protein YbjQ (UPF0145 family)